MATQAQYECLYARRTDIPIWWQAGGNIYDPAHYAQMAANWWGQNRAGDESAQYTSLDAYLAAIGCGPANTPGGVVIPPSLGSNPENWWKTITRMWDADPVQVIAIGSVVSFIGYLWLKKQQDI